MFYNLLANEPDIFDLWQGGGVRYPAEVHELFDFRNKNAWCVQIARGKKERDDSYKLK